MRTNKTILFLLLSFLLIFAGCKKDENLTDPPLPNESEVLAQYMEANGDYINTQAPTFITASEVREGQLNKTNQIVLDLRNSCDFETKGHIEGAFKIRMKDIPWYYRTNDLAAKEKVIITCNTGQEASYAVALLRYYGYTNVYGMMWGMTSWNARCDSWTPFISDQLASQFTQNSVEKNSGGGMPEINTGKTTPDEILRERVTLILDAGFDEAKISTETLFMNLSDYFLVNYASFEEYSAGHIPNSVQYTPGADLKLNTYLKTLPVDKTIVLYCSTGQTAFHAAAYLKILGYNAKSVLFGNNGMNYSTMRGKKFNPAEINDFPYVH
ncbi:MAG: rhodanese-like domain-containing protein [Ignavibacteriaceae bacterium]